MRLTLFQEGHRHSHVALQPHVTVDISTINPVVRPVTTQLGTVRGHYGTLLRCLHRCSPFPCYGEFTKKQKNNYIPHAPPMFDGHLYPLNPYDNLT